MSHAEPHIIGLCPSTSYLLQMYIKRRTNKRPEKKTTVFTKKICKFKTSYYLCNTKFQRWIHLRVRIRASHARHRGSNPLSTTKGSLQRGCFFVSHGAEATARGDENPSSDKRSSESPANSVRMAESRRLKASAAKSIPYPLPKAAYKETAFSFLAPQSRHKDRESRFEPDAQRGYAKIACLIESQRLQTMHALTFLRTQFISGSDIIKNSPESGPAKIINLRLMPAQAIFQFKPLSLQAD